jgi:hypothetical protein
MVKINYTFIKVPLDPEVKNKYPLVKDFGPMEELYLGLMENKLKIKPEAVGKPFDFHNSEKHDISRRNFNIETSRNFENTSEYDEGEYSGEEGDETESGDEGLRSGSEEEEETKEFHKYIDNSPAPPKPWVSGTFKRHEIPTLDQLKMRGQINPRSEAPAAASQEVNQEDRKRELMFKFEILRKSYKNQCDKVPEITIYTPLEQMENMYETTKKHLKLDESVDSNKKKLIYAFMVIEWVLGRFLKLDMEGFARHQILNIDSYDKLLFELGEKSYSVTKKEWPIEVRILLLVLFNAAGFILAKMLDGGGIMNILNAVLSPQGNQPIGTKRKMRGPTVDVNQLP